MPGRVSCCLLGSLLFWLPFREWELLCSVNPRDVTDWHCTKVHGVGSLPRHEYLSEQTGHFWCCRCVYRPALWPVWYQAKCWFHSFPLPLTCYPQVSPNLSIAAYLIFSARGRNTMLKRHWVCISNFCCFS